MDIPPSGPSSVARRSLVLGALAIALAGPYAAAAVQAQGRYGLIGRIRATAGNREALLGILLEGVNSMPGCLLYAVARDRADADAIWVTEAWESREAHTASLQLPSVRNAIARARPLIAGFESIAETEPVGGSGLPGS